MRGVDDSADIEERVNAITVSTDPIAGTTAAPSAAELASPGARPSPFKGSRLEGAATIGRFLLLRKLGEGGMGEVYSGYDEQLDRKVAIKVLHAAYAPEEIQKRTLREAQALARLSHPNVVAVHEVGQVNGDVFVVMEHIDGKTLRTWQDEAPRTVEEILQAYVQAGRGLAAVHTAGMVHRDFKPHNAMISRQGRVRILDFGLARVNAAEMGNSASTNPVANIVKASHTDAGAFAGTPAYMSPEQFTGESLDARTDQFSFCVALYEALYKELPKAENTAKKGLPGLAQTLSKPRARDDLPPRVTEALVRGLSQNRDARFADMNELLQHLEVAPHADPSGQARQRLLFAGFLVFAMGLWVVAPDEIFVGPTVMKAMFVSAMMLTTVAAGTAYIFRTTLFRNPFHRTRIVFLLIMGLLVTASRGVGILLHEPPEIVVVRDMFIATTGVALGTLVLVPRVDASWATLAATIGGIGVLSQLPGYLAEIAIFTMNLAILGYLLAWHRSSRIVANADQASGRQ
ncbi:MAG TPA: serine/threonine-protein kinase [Polyangium sp.]|nr:serine/threonine-protein kinase [Polyangium sp.]